jgi:hypothetical protein
MICPECKQYSETLTSLFNGTYKVCNKCNEEFLYYEKQVLQLSYEEKVNAIFMAFLL